jgi:hypothetical protein
MVIFDPIAHHQLDAFVARFPPRCHASTRRLAAEVCQKLVGFVQNVALLL